MSRRHQVLAVDIGAGHVTAGVVSAGGKILFSQSMETQDPERPGSLIGRLEELIRSQLLRAHEQKLELAGIGIGSPGIVNSALGIVVAAGNLPELFGAHLGERFAQAFALPVLVENDVNALALGEMLFGVAKGQKNFIVFALGTDLGGGVVLDGKLIPGANFIAAEFGHLTLDLHGKKCVCGGVGCAREWVSGAGLAERARELLPEESQAIALAGTRSQVSAAEVFQAAEQGDRPAAELVEEFGRRFGALVSNVMKVLDPEVVVLGGEVCRTEPQVMNLVARWTRHYYFPIPKLPEFRLSQFSKGSAILGPAAAFLVKHRRRK